METPPLSGFAMPLCPAIRTHKALELLEFTKIPQVATTVDEPVMLYAWAAEGSST